MEDYIEWPDRKVIRFLAVSYHIKTNISQNNFKSLISRLHMIPVILYLYQALLAVLVLLQDLDLFLHILVLVLALVLALVWAGLMLILILSLKKALLRIIGSWARQ